LALARERRAVFAFHLRMLRDPVREEQWYSKAAAPRRDSMSARSFRIASTSAERCENFFTLFLQFVVARGIIAWQAKLHTRSSTKKGDAEPLARMKTTLVLNPKGGAGKTTIATNLASCFAAADIPTTLMDYDPQGSSMNWLRLRPAHAAPIHRANGA